MERISFRKFLTWLVIGTPAPISPGLIVASSHRSPGLLGIWKALRFEPNVVYAA